MVVFTTSMELILTNYSPSKKKEIESMAILKMDSTFNTSLINKLSINNVTYLYQLHSKSQLIETMPINLIAN